MNKLDKMSKRQYSSGCEKRQKAKRRKEDAEKISLKLSSWLTNSNSNAISINQPLKNNEYTDNAGRNTLIFL